MLPKETITALYPPDGSLTLAHIVAMEALGVNIDHAISTSNALIAKWVIEQPSDKLKDVFSPKFDKREIKKYITHFDGYCEEVVDEVNTQLAKAFSTAILPKTNGQATSFCKKGLGWTLELAEWYAHEYASSIEVALKVPLVRLFALIACARQRKGGEHGSPDFYERLEIDKFKANDFAKM